MDNNKQTPIKTANDLKGRTLERSLLVERAAVDTDKRTVTLAFAGETPCERWYGNEILDCNSKSIRLDRLKNGGPLLVGHDAEEQVGVVESVEIGPDKVCRAVVRFGRSADAEEIFQDVLDGIRRHVSVGYMVHEAQLESEKEGVATYRVIDWEPYEVSLVPMPADFKTAGVGRSADLTDSPEIKPEPIIEEEKPAMEEKDLKAATDKAATEARAAEQKRTADLLAAAKTYEARGGQEIAARLITEGGSVDDFRAAMLAKIDAEQKATETTRREGHLDGSPRVEVSQRFDKRSLVPFKEFSVQRGITAERAAFEAGMWARAMFYNDEKAVRWCIDNNLNLRVQNSDSGSAGGYLVPEGMESAIIDLRVQYGALRQLAEYWPMSSGTLPIPVLVSGTTAYFPGQIAATTESDAVWGEVNLTAKDLSALTRISNALVEDATIDLAAKVARLHAEAFAQKEDECFIDGDGTSTYGGITGLKAKLEAAGMAGIYTTATNSDTPAEIIEGEISGLMSKLPMIARRGAVFLSSPTFDELIFGRLMRAAGGNTTTTLAGEVVQAYSGKPRVLCEPCYSNPTTDLTGKAMAFYGDFGRGVALGERRGIVVQVLRERYAEYRQIGVIATERVDINCHGVGTTSAVGPIVALIGG